MKVWRVEAEDGTGPYGPGVNDAKHALEARTGQTMWKYQSNLNYQLNPIYRNIQIRQDLAETLSDEHGFEPGVETHPGPWQEGWLEFQYLNKVFGFYSIEQARAWFAGFGQRLTDAGYHLSEYDVEPNEILYGKYQVAFTVPKGQTPVRHPVIKEIP